MNIIRSALSAAIVAALVAIGAPSGAGFAAPPEPEAVTNEYLVGPEADLGRLPHTAVVRDLGGGWRLVVHEEAGSPRTIARRLAGEARGRVVPNVILEPASPADEPRFAEQWALENTGQSGGVAGADIDARPAWDLTTGQSTVVVAVLDSGIDLDHIDLAANLWTNPGEIAANGIDDDGNGHIDDVNGWDFVGNDADVSDTTGHGTQVTGLLAAAVNGTGITGVAPNVKIMPVRVCAAGCPLGDITAGLTYAAAEGAVIANMAFTGAGEFFAPIGDVLATDAAGVLAVAAAGNETIDIDVDPRYPASFDLPNVVAVAATDDTDDLSSFSNFGAESVDLGAPGEVLLTTNFDGKYLDVSGTSFSTPLVSGVAALIASLRPETGPDDLAAFILDTVESLPGLAGVTVTGGRLDAGAAVTAAASPEPVITITPAEPFAPVTLQISGEDSYAPVGKISSYEWSFSDGVTATGEVVSRTFERAVSLRVDLTVTSDVGLSATASETINVRSEDAIVTATPRITAAPGTVTVSAALPAGTATAATWDFGDGFTATGTTATHVFEDRGVYTVEAEVVGDSGTIATGETDVFIGVDFIDTTNSLFRTDILWLSATGITRSCNPPLETKFCPAATISRGQTAAMLVRAFGLPAGPDAFVDDDESIFERDINALAAAGLTSGCNPPDNDRYCPDRSLTRAEFATLFTRALELTGGDDRFVDDDGSPHEAAINALADAGLTSGCNPPDNDEFCPNQHLTRAQVAAFFHRAGVYP